MLITVITVIEGHDYGDENRVQTITVIMLLNHRNLATGL